MKISEIGEFGFIDAIKENTLFAPESVVVGIGDDGAVYKTSEGMEQVAVIDTMVENSHFIIGRTATWYDVGYKAVASNLSDIAAMGAIPTHMVLSTAISPDMEVDSLIDLYKGIKTICQAYHVNVLGGDTVTSKQGLVITVAAFGEVEAGRALLRSGAQPGDVVGVSHCIGDSGAGLDVLLAGAGGFDCLIRAHRLPLPQVEIGRQLLAHGCHSLNDISDGLASEANEIAAASGVQLIVDRKLIPVSPELRQWCHETGHDMWQYVFCGGEDYELIFTMAPDDFNELKSLCDVTPIGTVRSGEPGVVLVIDGAEEILRPGGFHHFTNGDKS